MNDVIKGSIIQGSSIYFKYIWEIVYNIDFFVLCVYFILGLMLKVAPF